ncbi:MAG: 3'-5' exonuclease [Verrucomicrobia bacterium]|nr:MAG: 3'-5' exonuclease [Verrucomicrobiota bacterium]TAE89317.1 MAG: 3'-5' exonuclease [Verrucomicrobiota bacterium]TAF27807.1 MAG: 3'-5' exonuclease [Verrucomicrobiota bacterium]TAF42656.1 MAG: 3'-5' exonuclease [Verrucomicrobiota bacterium]
MLIGDSRFTAIDFESAGAARGRTDVPVQVGLCCWSVREGHGDHFVSYLASEAPITWSARKVHGIKDADLIGAPPLLALWPQLKQRLAGSAVVAHGKGTEKRFLRSFPGHGFGPWIDTLLLARAAWPDLSDHSLSAICDARGLSATISQVLPNRRWHDALYDAFASVALLADLIRTFELADRPLESLLQPDLSVWHRHRNKH